MGKSYDAEKVSGFMSDLCSSLNGYRADADKLENAYNKYACNDTFRGAAAKAAKRCIDRGQRNLHKENLVVQKKALARYKDMKDLFEDMVDSSPKARIDTDVLKEVKKDFQGFRKIVSDHGYNIEKIAEYLRDNFSEECEVDFTQPSYQGARDAYSEFSGPNGFIDKTNKSFEDFDEQACDAVNRSGIAAYIYDYQQAISQTSYNLLGIKIEAPKVDDTYLNTITNGAAIGVKAVVANGQNGENSNTTNLSILNSSKVDKWLSPDYKLTPEEIKEARELARKELDGVERVKGTHQPIFNNKTEEENYKKALALMNKCSGVASYCQGFMSLIGNIATVPQNIVEDIIVGGFGEIGATMVDNTFGTDLSSDVRNLREQMQNSISQQEADLKLAKQNARTQHPDAFMAGDTTFKAIMYFATEGLFAAAAEGLEISKFAAVQIAENAQDLMLDTTSVYNELIEDGNLSGSDWAALGSNVLLNAMNNLAFSQLNELVDICKAKYAVDPVVVKKAGNVAEEASDATKIADEAIDIGKDDLDLLRKKLGVPETNTIAVGKTNVKGLENITFEGASPKVRQQAGIGDLDDVYPNRKIVSPGKIASTTRHAEEGVANEFVNAVENAGLKPEEVVGTLKIHQSNPKGVCPTCLSGLGNPNKPAGVIKQLSEKYPNLTIEVTSESVDGVKANGRLNFTVKNGTYIEK